MITVVSLNPSIDRTLTLSELRKGSTNRARSARVDAGGKGMNVCRHLKALGAESVRCVGFMRQADEKMFTESLAEAGVEHRWLMLPGHVRTNTKVCADDGELTEINESGELVAPEALDDMLAMCREAFSDSNAVVLTGSVPPGVPKNVYAELMAIAHDCGAAVLLDADGEALRHGIAAKPEFVKPNRAELEGLLKCEIPDDAALMKTADRLQADGIAYGCISLGGEGAMYFSDAWKLRLPALNVPVRSTVGAGDAMTAAFALGQERKLGEKETFCLAVAASAEAVSSEGTQPVDGVRVQKLLKYIPMLMHDMVHEAPNARTAEIIRADGMDKLDESTSVSLIQRQIASLYEAGGR